MPRSRAAKSTVTGRLFKLWSVAYRILDMEGHTDLTQGHLSIRDPDGRGFWMKRTGIAFSEVKATSRFRFGRFRRQSSRRQGRCTR